MKRRKVQYVERKPNSSFNASDILAEGLSNNGTVIKRQSCKTSSNKY